VEKIDMGDGTYHTVHERGDRVKLNVDIRPTLTDLRHIKKGDTAVVMGTVVQGVQPFLTIKLDFDETTLNVWGFQVDHLPFA